MFGDTISSSAQQEVEIIEAVRKQKEKDILSDFCRLVDSVGVDEVFNRMEGDTFWKLYTYFRTTLTDADR